MVAYRPALLFSDSWAYISTAFAHHLVSLPYLRPIGYSILIRVLTIPGRDLTQLVALQHLAGLAIGAGVYAALVRAGVRRVWAVAASTLVILDGYAITLEQYVMPDTFFALTLLLALLVLGLPRLISDPRAGASTSPRRAALSGLLVAAAALQREVALFALPVMLIYLIWALAGWRASLALLIAAAIPLCSYAAVMDAKTGVFGITATSGWTLYSRVAGFARCSEAGIAPDARPLCETAEQRSKHVRGPGWYMWDAASPANRLFRSNHETRAQKSRANGILGGFAQQIILHQPGAFAAAAGTDFLRYFTPGATSRADAVSATSLPQAATEETVDAGIRRRLIPKVHPVVESPATFMRRYRQILHVPRFVLSLLGVLTLAGLGFRVASRREVLLFGGTALTLLLGTAATAGFGLRYLLPVVPLLAIGGGLAGRDLGARVRELRGGRWHSPDTQAST
ncbi:MAG TPA: hypothetical protein VG405_08765 [Solirubrobacteraceae bacterium]|jgi:hypothetical protein|nr:hypothetical protein [Solirubrobacteraceae bacterium]